jgi:hypothetical protein
LPVPGNTRTLGPFGIEVHAPSTARASRERVFKLVDMAAGSVD